MTSPDMPSQPSSNLLVHVGYHKTGSTWLQEGLFQNGRYGFKTVDGRHPANFGWKFIYGGRRGLRSIFDFDIEAVRHEYTSLIKDTQEHIVISNEAFVGHMFNGGILAREHAVNLADTFPDAKILIVTRRQKDLIRSIYSDFLEGGGACSLQQFLQPGNDGQIPLFSAEYAKFHHLVRMYKYLFGSGQVLVLPYELLRKDAKAFIQAIAKFSGLPALGDSELNAICSSTANVSSNSRFAFLASFPRINLVGARTNNNGKAALGLRSLRRYSVYYGAKSLPKAYSDRKVSRMIAYIDQQLGSTFIDSNRKLQTMVEWKLADFDYEVD